MKECSVPGLHELAEHAVESGAVPGLIAAVATRDSQRVVTAGSAAFGGPPLSPDALFRISSMTKPLAGSLAMHLASEGMFRFDDPVTDVLPELKNRRVLRTISSEITDTVHALRDITVRDLLTFTSGFGNDVSMFSEDPLPIVVAEAETGLQTLGPPNPDLVPEPDEWMARFSGLPLIAQPGERWLYNTSASLLGIFLARKADMPLPDLFASRLLDPLGMESTRFSGDPGRIVPAYRDTDGTLTVSDPPDGQWSHPPAFPDAAAGLLSTIGDLLSYARMMMEGGTGLIDPPFFEAMTTPQVTDLQLDGAAPFLGTRKWGFCQSVHVSGPRRGAFGWDGGYGSSLLIDAGRGIAVIVLTQRLFTDPRTPKLHLDIQDLAYAAHAA